MTKRQLARKFQITYSHLEASDGLKETHSVAVFDPLGKRVYFRQFHGQQSEVRLEEIALHYVLRHFTKAQINLLLEAKKYLKVETKTAQQRRWEFNRGQY